MRLLKVLKDLELELQTAFKMPVEIIIKDDWSVVAPNSSCDKVRFIFCGLPESTSYTNSYNNQPWHLYLNSVNLTFKIKKYVNSNFPNIYCDDRSNNMFGRYYNDFYFSYEFEEMTQAKIADFIKYIIPKVKPSITRVGDVTSDDLTEIIKSQTNLFNQNWEQNLKSTEDSIRSLASDIEKYVARRRECLDMIAHKKDHAAKLVEKAVAQEKEIASLIGKMYQSVRFDTSRKSIIAKTTQITIKDGDTDYDLGHYTIEIKPSGSPIFSITTDKGEVLGYRHPHIDGSSICFGAISNDVSKLLGDGEFGILLQLLFSYLKSYNANDAYIHLLNFKPEAWNNSSWGRLDIDDDYDDEDEDEDEEEEDN